jgi:gluconokinase
LIIVVMGVSGSGKTTVGRLLADRLGWDFLEGDDLHPQANIDKMRRGLPLDAADREPWLARIAAALEERRRAGANVVVACSALTEDARGRLKVGPDVRFVFLKGSYDLIRGRLEGRKGHFFSASLLASQFSALEPPGESALVVDISEPPEAIADRIMRALDLDPQL